MKRHLPIVVRAYTEREFKSKLKTPISGAPEPKWPNSVLVFDTETTTDPTQRLLFGSYRYYRWKAGLLECVEEGVFYADELPEKDPEGYECLGCVRDHQADVVPGVNPALLLMPRSEFVKKKLFPIAYDLRASVVGFNLSFDLSRVAVDWKEARRFYEGGFSLVLNDYPANGNSRREDPYVPRLRVKQIDSKRSLFAFARPPRIDKSRNRREYFGGYFVDVRTLAFALTNAAYSLQGACEHFKVKDPKLKFQAHGQISADNVTYNRGDVRATAQLLEKLRAEFDLHPIELAPYKSRSPASVAKAYLRAMGVVPPAQKFANISREFLGYAMSGYFGGRAECHIRNIVVPVVYCDFLSMYPTVNALMGLWWLLTGERLRIVDATEEVRRFLDGVTLEDCFRKNTWPELLFFAEILPDGDILPVRSPYDPDTDAYNIGLNRLYFHEPLWYAAPDLVASKLLAGKVPSVRRAYRLVAEGRQAGLRPVRLRDAIPVDPTKEDFFRAVIEQRKRLTDGDPLSDFLKVLANSGSYGIFAEMNRQELPPKKLEKLSVWGLLGKFIAESRAPEEPGPFCFPPIAALITSAEVTAIGV